jgi:hypothetical protein
MHGCMQQQPDRSSACFETHQKASNTQIGSQPLVARRPELAAGRGTHMAGRSCVAARHHAAAACAGAS